MKQYNIWNGELQLDFDADNHTYYLNGNHVNNVTTILKVISNAGALLGWSAKTCSERFKELVQPNKTYDEIAIDTFADDIKKCIYVKRDEAGLIGSRIHDLIENYLHHKEVANITNPEMINCFNLFRTWYDRQNMEVVFTERKVYSKKHNYCGTADALFKENGEYLILDWKTGKAVYDTYKIQLAYYAMALEEELGIQIKKGRICNFSKFGKKPQIVDIEIDSTIRDVCLNVLNLHKYLNNKKDKK